LSKIITEWQLEDQELKVINAAMEIADHLNLREIDHIYKSALTPLEKLYKKQNKNLSDLLEIA
jgi:pantothenate kinase